MTDIMKLADAYAIAREHSLWVKSEQDRAALQSAIEVLQAENERLKEERDTNATDWVDERAELRAERDALQAKLDELQRQEPVRQWVDLTDEEIMEIRALKDGRPYGTFELCRAICEALRKKNAAPKALEPLTDERKEAMAVYAPPFKYQHGYIFDSQQHMVADDDKVEESVAARIRGWGKLSYLPNGAAIQDELGKTVADALTAYYAAHGITKGTQ